MYVGVSLWKFRVEILEASSAHKIHKYDCASCVSNWINSASKIYNHGLILSTNFWLAQQLSSP